MRRLAFIVTFLVGTVGAVQWLSQNYLSSWEPSLRTYLEDTAGRATHTHVQIDSITPSFFHRVRLVNVRVTELDNPTHPLFQATDIELTLSLIDLPRAIAHRRPYEAIGLITIRNPWIRLSQETLSRHSSHTSSVSSLPPWFTLAWEGATIQWLDPRAPRGRWTLYQGQGAFRIRGPQMNFAIRGSVQEARSIRFQFSSLGHRWNAQARVSDGDSQSFLTLLQVVLKKPILPKGWAFPGGFHLETRASGRVWPVRGEDPTRFLDEATLTLVPSAVDRHETGPTVGISGTLTYKKGKITSPNLSFASPWFEGVGRAEVSLENLRTTPQITLNANLSSGKLGHWPFQDAVIQTRYLNEHWEFLQNTFRFLNGKVSAKGYVSGAGSDLAITADNVSLAALGQEHGIKVPEGRLNVSSTLKGTFEDWRIAGAWWLSDLQWGQTSVGNARGDFEVTEDHFQAQAKSDNTHFRFALEGTQSEKDLDLDRLEVHLPSGATFVGTGHLDRSNRHIQGTLDTDGIDFPADLPFLPLDQLSLKGFLSAHAKINGTLEAPALKGTLQSSNMVVADQALGKAKASFLWDKTKLEIPAFHMDCGVDGRYLAEHRADPSEWDLDLALKGAPTVLLGAGSMHPFVSGGSLDGKVHLERHMDLKGNGSLKLQNADAGKWHLNQSALVFDLKPDQLHITEFSAETSAAKLQWKGKVTWAGEKIPPKKLVLQGQGNIHSLVDPGAWDIPFDVLGHLASDENGWNGTAQIQANHPVFRTKAVEPFELHLQWSPSELSWTNAHWGHHWNSQGSLRWDKDPARWSARIQADRVPLAEWQPLLWPQYKESIQGLLSGTLTLSGSGQHPLGELNFHVDDGRWRAFPFSTDLHGVWEDGKLKPLTLNGHFKTGGDFQFNGLLSAEGRAEGTLKLDGFNLRPLGESLHFPKTLEGTTKATLTLNGPLDRLSWSGHLEGGPFIYAGTSDHPFTLEHLSTDMTLAPLAGDPTVTHLTLTEGEAKTAEELIRFRPGSFIEFAGPKPARLQLGMDIRNLHLGIFTLFGGLDMNGTWQIQSAGFAIQAQAQTHSLFINDYELEEGVLLTDYYNGVLKFQAPPHMPALVTGSIDFHNAPQLKFTDFFISGKDRQGLELSGDIGPSLWDFKMAGRGLDIGILGELAGFPYAMSGAANVQVHGKGDAKHPHVEGSVDLDRGSALGLAFRSGTAAFVWQDARITFTKLFLTNPGHYNLEGSGSFPLIPKAKTTGLDHSIDFSVRLRDSNLSLLQSFSDEVKQAKGAVEGLIQIKGTLEDPSLHGSVRVTNGEILGAHYFRQLRNANLSVDFDDDKVIIRELRGKSGDGEFRSSGTITLAGFQPSEYDLSFEVVSSKGLDVQVPELAIPESPLAKRFKFLTTASHSDVRGHVTLRGPAEAPVFSGVGIFSNGHFTFPPSHKNPPSLAVMEWFRRITWDVNLKFQDGAWFENELVQAGVVGNLALKGPSDMLRVDGSLDIPEGKISYLGLQFDIQQARYDVRSEVTGDKVVNTPYMRGVAECQIQAVDTVSGVAGSSGGSRLNVNDVITLNIDYAPVSDIKPRLTSATNPTLSQDKLLARVTQTDVENLTPQERNYLYQKQIVSLIDNSLTTPLAQNVLKKTGIADRLRVQHVFDPNAVTGQDLNTTGAPQQQSAAVSLLANTKYTVEKDLSNRLSLGYGVRFVPSAVVDPDIQQQKLDLVSDVQLSYRWFRNVYLRGDFDLPTSNPNILPERKVTIEPRWRFGWWGNTNKDKQPPKASQ